MINRTARYSTFYIFFGGQGEYEDRIFVQMSTSFLISFNLLLPKMSLYVLDMCMLTCIIHSSLVCLLQLKNLNFFQFIDIHAV